MRLIDADALINEFDQTFLGNNPRGIIRATIENAPTIEPERKKGKWIEKDHAYSDEESVIEEWQSCRCSECGRYDTRPYMYYFSEPNYCSYCGADMRERRPDGEIH